MRISLFETGFECEPHMGLAELGGFRAYLMGLPREARTTWAHLNERL